MVVGSKQSYNLVCRYNITETNMNQFGAHKSSYRLSKNLFLLEGNLRPSIVSSTIKWLSLEDYHPLSATFIHLQG